MVGLEGMLKDRNDWFTVIFLLFFVAILYAFNSYDDLFSRRLAYLYDPASDDVYSVQMAPSLDMYRKWETFVPFKPLRYIKPDGAEYIGKLERVDSTTKCNTCPTEVARVR